MLKLEKTSGDPAVKAWFKKTMESDHDHVDAGAFTPLQRFVMELFRVRTPLTTSMGRRKRLPPSSRLCSRWRRHQRAGRPFFS